MSDKERLEKIFLLINRPVPMFTPEEHQVLLFLCSSEDEFLQINKKNIEAIIKGSKSQ